MAKQKKLTQVTEKPIEAKLFTDSEGTGYAVRVYRGTDIDRIFDVPHYMTGVDFRKWRKNTKDVVDAWRNYEDVIISDDENV